MNRSYVKGLVSVIIPTRNRPDFIWFTLESVLHQTYKDIEILLVDDHSDPEYICYLEDLISKYKSTNRIFLFQNEGAGGCAARNTGIRHSKGQYIQFFDDDDLMLPEHIEKKVMTIKEGGYDYSACNYNFFNTNNPDVIVDRKIISSIYHVAAVHILSKSLPTPCFMCTRDTIYKIGFWNESIKKLQDFSYFHRLFLFECKGVYLEDELFSVRVHGNSITRSNINAIEGQIYTLESIKSVKKEWKTIGGDKWESVKLPIVFMEFTTGRNLILKGYKRQGLTVLMKLAFENPIQISRLIIRGVKNRTIHLTEILIAEYSQNG